MNKQRGFVLFAGLIVATMLVASCVPTPATQPAAQQPAAQQPAATEKKPYEIAVVVKLTGIPWFNTMETGVKEAAQELGVNAYQTGPAQADPAQQVKVVEDLIAKGVDAICVVPNDAKSLEPVFAKAKAAGIKIVTHESPDQVGNDYDIEMIDNKAFGEHAFDLFAQYAGDTGEYAIFVGSLTVPAHNAWADAGIAYAATKYPGLKQATDRIACSEDQDLSRQKTLELMKAYPDLKGIIGFGSNGPPGAAQAVEEKDLIGKFTVVGTVLPSQGAPYLKTGSLNAGILWSPKDAGYDMVWIAKQLLDGKEITDGMEIPRAGKVSVKDRVIQANAVLDINKDNADSFGF